MMLLATVMGQRSLGQDRGQPAVSRKPVKIIYDTDIDLDVDDAGALAVLHALADRGEAEILGIVVNAPTPYGASTVAAVNRYYGRPHIPVGDMPPLEYLYDQSFDKFYRSYSVSTPYGNFNLPIFRQFDHGIKSRQNVWDGVALYRKLLSEAPDQSVTIAAVGLLTVLEDLLQSPPDSWSPLPGKDLIKLKVKELVCMAGGNQPAPGRATFNWGFDGRGDAQRITRGWPTPLYLSPTGGKVGTGARLSTETPESNPVRVAYELFLKPARHKNRPSWDQIAVYYAVRGASDIFVEPPGRRLEVTAERIGNGWRDGTYTWRDARPGEPLHVRIAQKISDESLAGIIEDLMVQLPARGAGPATLHSGQLPAAPVSFTGTRRETRAADLTILLNEEPIKPEDAFIITDQETLKWNAPGGQTPEVIMVNAAQSLPEASQRILKSGKSALVLVHDQHREVFARLRQASQTPPKKGAGQRTGTVVFVLTRQDKAPWYSVQLTNAR